MWRLVIKNPCGGDEVLCHLEGRSVKDIADQYAVKYNNDFINYYKLDNIKRGRSVKAYPFVILERFTTGV
tara:strand:+ start:130 stop:339 length:210 start_codon:yes stop_codon:yes gene_type:complete